MFSVILEKIKEYNRIIIHRHIRADGDCVGSQTGLKLFIKENFKEKEVYCVGDDIPEYIQIGSNDTIPDEYYDDALVIVVDTSNPDRICDNRWQKGKYIIKIDHHDDSPEFGDYEYVDAKSPSCSSIITSMIRSFNLPYMPKEAAYALYFGIVTDTGRFKYRGVNSEIFSNAAFLMSCGIDIQPLYDRLYVNSNEELKLQGYLLTHYKVTPNGVAYMHFTKKIMKKFNVTKEEAGNLINTLSTIKGSLIWVAFIDQMLPKGINERYNLPQEKEVRVRLRSRGVAINDVASLYRGGGHLQACGATIFSKKEKESLLHELDLCLMHYKKDHPDAI